jgi:predicted HAD superfamily Cof-like phosphohydrolase
MASYLQLIKQFTEESSGKSLPTKPSKMTKEEVRFLVRMVISELMELVRTVVPNENQSEHVYEFTRQCMLSTDKPRFFDTENSTDEEIMAEQYDAFGDWIIYTLDMAGKKGVDLDRFIHLAHDANMAKRFPDGKFHRREEDGKVIKPQGWVEPDLVKEIKRQLSE